MVQSFTQELLKSVDSNGNLEHRLKKMIEDHLKDDANRQDQETGRNYLHLICAGLGSVAKTSNNLLVKETMTNLINLAIAKGININSVDKDGNTALHLLIYHYKCSGLQDIVTLFVDKNANVNAKNDIQQSAIGLLKARREAFNTIDQLLRNRNMMHDDDQ